MHSQQKGAGAGGANITYRLAYAFFEKQRIKDKRAKERVLTVSEWRSAAVASILWNIISLIGLLWYHRNMRESDSEQSPQLLERP